jgi:hypothetical protein
MRLKSTWGEIPGQSEDSALSNCIPGGWQSRLNSFSKDAILALSSGILYVFLRYILHYLIIRAGYTDGGLISYDSYYHFAFVEEFRRNPHALLFQNPFGTLDNEPHLFNLYSSFLSLFHPLYSPNLFLFDCLSAALFIVVSSFLLCRIVAPLGVLDKTILLFGGSLTFIGVSIGGIPLGEGLAVAYWGSNYLLNQIATPEIVYHFLFFLGLYCLTRHKDPWVLSVIAALTLLHPFTAITFNVTVLIAWLFSLVKTHKVINPRFRLALYAAASVITCGLLFQHILPFISRDAAYFKGVYETAHFHIPFSTYASSLILPVSYFLGALILSKSPSFLQERSEMVYLFLGTSLFCIFMSTSYLYTDKIVQPAHWSRVYPHVLIFAAAGLHGFQGGTKSLRNRFSAIIKVCFLAVALLDNAIGVLHVSNALFDEKRPPLFLTPDQSKVIEKSKTLPAGRFFYFRDGTNRSLFGGFEYAVMALSRQKGFFGHTFFSPFLGSYSSVSYLRNPGSPLTDYLLRESDYIILDKALVHTFPHVLGAKLYEGDRLLFIHNSVSPSLSKKVDGLTAAPFSPRTDLRHLSHSKPVDRILITEHGGKGLQ